MKIIIKQPKSFIFAITTIVFIITRFILFRGFNGTDDLHYAMLASKLLKGVYNPFEPGDIFSGRILLIALQAFIYKVGGITIFATGAGTVIAVIISCFLMVYKIIPEKNVSSILLSCCLFYFNPALTEATKGILPDAYVMLCGILIYLLLKPILVSPISFNKKITNNLLAGILIGITLLIKETVLVFVPFFILMQLIYNGKKGLASSIFMLISFSLIIILIAFCYYHFTGNVFMKIVQIKNSAYPNPCNFDNLPFKDILVRLTYGVYQEFIVNGFYPLVLSCIVILIKLLNLKKIQFKKDLEFVCFFLLLFISLYFPFSLKGYQPLCSSCRQFLFLQPFAVVLFNRFLNEENGKLNKIFLTLFSLLVLVIVITSTGNKWQLLIYSMLFAYFLYTFLFKCFSKNVNILIISMIFFLSIFESIFFLKTHWFKDIQQLSKKTNGIYYYFPDHDNMMHWKLLHQFNETSITYYSIEKDPFKIFKIYYQFPDNIFFHPGWLIINNRYTELSRLTLNKIDSLQKSNYFADKVIIGNASAFFIQSKEQLFYIENIISK